MPTMRVAVAGTGGLARLIAHAIVEGTNHSVVLLSRMNKPELNARGFQVVVVDYSDAEDLNFALRGIDTVISTVTGPNQIQLIKAAVSSRVRRFAPAEFEGSPQLRSQNDPLDRCRASARYWLQYYRSRIQSTVFICGVFYERFQPGGLPQSLIALNTGYHGEGTYILDCARMSAELPVFGPGNRPDVTICMTSIRDAANFVAKAISLPTWPAELYMVGERITVQNLATLVERLKKKRFQPRVIHNLDTLRTELVTAATTRDWARGMRLHELIATVEGKYDFPQRSLNTAFPGVHVESFADWFSRKWDLQQD